MKSLNYNRDLIERCKQNDANAQFTLYKSYSRAMYNICLRMLNNEMDAEDMLQNSFVDVYRNLHTFNYQATPGAWIKRIVINNCINHLKKRRITFEDMSNIAEPPSEVIVEVSDSCISVARIKSALSKLSVGYRTVFTLYAIEGYDHSEIAEVMGITESTSKSQYHRAKIKLKSILSE